MVSLGIQHAMRTRHIVTWPARLYIFSHYLINDAIFEGKNVIERIKSVFLFSVLFRRKHFSF
jgi:hypothetical protein